MLNADSHTSGRHTPRGTCYSGHIGTQNHTHFTYTALTVSTGGRIASLADESSPHRRTNIRPTGRRPPRTRGQRVHPSRPLGAPNNPPRRPGGLRGLRGPPWPLRGLRGPPWGLRGPPRTRAVNCASARQRRYSGRYGSFSRPRSGRRCGTSGSCWSSSPSSRPAASSARWSARACVRPRRASRAGRR